MDRSEIMSHKRVDGMFDFKTFVIMQYEMEGWMVWPKCCVTKLSFFFN